MRRAGNVIVEACGEQVAGIEIAATVILLNVVGVICNCCAVLADLIQSVRPSVAQLRSQAVPGADPEDGLKSVVIGCASAVELQDGAVLMQWICIKDPVLVNVFHDIQLASLAAHISDLEHRGFTKALLDLQVVVVEIRGAEVLVDRKEIQSGTAGAQRIGTSRDSRKD